MNRTSDHAQLSFIRKVNKTPGKLSNKDLLKIVSLVHDISETYGNYEPTPRLFFTKQTIKSMYDEIKRRVENGEASQELLRLYEKLKLPLHPMNVLFMNDDSNFIEPLTQTDYTADQMKEALKTGQLVHYRNGRAYIVNTDQMAKWLNLARKNHLRGPLQNREIRRIRNAKKRWNHQKATF